MTAQLMDEIDDKLFLKWGPEQISGWLNENTNGLLRQYFPKDTDFKTVNAVALKKSVNELNNRPRKTLAFKTPAVLMQEELAALAA
jgi:IS30 family transposase